MAGEIKVEGRSEKQTGLVIIQQRRSNMAFDDLREFITKCEQLGDVQRIKQEVDWNLEAGAITRRCCELSAPAPFFQKIRDYPKGYRLLGAPLATFRRLAIAMDLDPDSSFREIMDAYISLPNRGPLL